MLRLGSFLNLIGLSILVWQQNFMSFCLSTFFLGLSYACFSGADTSLLYKTCHKYHQSYPDFESKTQFLGRLGEGCSSLIAAIITFFSTPALVLASIFSSLFKMLLSFKICDVSAHDQPRRHYFFEMLPEILKNGQNLIFLYSGINSALLVLSFWMLQIFLKHHHIPIFSIALINFIYFLICSIFSKIFKKIANRNQLLWIVIPLLLFIPNILFIFQTQLMFFPLVFLVAIAYGLKMPFIYQTLNRYSNDKNRAGFLSLDNIYFRILLCIFAYPIGDSIDHQGIEKAYFIMSVICFISLLLGIWLYRKKA